jgi:hypothetical protein
VGRDLGFGVLVVTWETEGINLWGTYKSLYTAMVFRGPKEKESSLGNKTSLGIMGVEKGFLAVAAGR